MAETCTICGRSTKTGSDHAFCTSKPEQVVKQAPEATPAA